MDTAERVQLTLSYLLSAILLLVFMVGLYQGQWFNAFLAFLAFVLSYVPALIERNYKIFLPVEMEFLMVFFIFSTIYLGTIHGYYEYYWWWDVFLHALSGVMLGFVGFIMVYILRTESRLGLRITPAFVGIFSFLFAVTLGTLWEIFEFLIDSSTLVHLTLQDDNFDTMMDLINDSLGALFVAVAGYLYCRKVRIPLFDRVVMKFVEKNPSLFYRFKTRSKSFLNRRINAVNRVRLLTFQHVKSLLRHLKRRRPR